jgi:hypothetical protein
MENNIDELIRSFKEITSNLDGVSGESMNQISNILDASNDTLDLINLDKFKGREREMLSELIKDAKVKLSKEYIRSEIIKKYADSSK